LPGAQAPLRATLPLRQSDETGCKNYRFEAGALPPLGGAPAGPLATPVMPLSAFAVGGFVAGPFDAFAFSTIALLFPFALAGALPFAPLLA
jgi:hypothetical protein